MYGEFFIAVLCISIVCTGAWLVEVSYRWLSGDCDDA